MPDPPPQLPPLPPIGYTGVLNDTVKTVELTPPPLGDSEAIKEFANRLAQVADALNNVLNTVSSNVDDLCEWQGSAARCFGNVWDLAVDPCGGIPAAAQQLKDGANFVTSGAQSIKQAQDEYKAQLAKLQAKADDANKAIATGLGIALVSIVILGVIIVTLPEDIAIGGIIAGIAEAATSLGPAIASVGTAVGGVVTFLSKINLPYYAQQTATWLQLTTSGQLAFAGASNAGGSLALGETDPVVLAQSAVIGVATSGIPIAGGENEIPVGATLLSSSGKSAQEEFLTEMITGINPTGDHGNCSECTLATVNRLQSIYHYGGKPGDPTAVAPPSEGMTLGQSVAGLQKITGSKPIIIESDGELRLSDLIAGLGPNSLVVVNKYQVGGSPFAHQFLVARFGGESWIVDAQVGLVHQDWSIAQSVGANGRPTYKLLVTPNYFGGPGSK